MSLLGVKDIIPINLMIDMMVVMLLHMKVVVVALRTIHMELVQTTHLQSLKEDIDMTNILNNMTNMCRV